MPRSTFYLMNKFDFTSKRCLKTFTPSQLGRVDFIKRLLASDVDAQALDSNGATPLHYAAAAGTTMSHCDSIVMLLGLGLRDRAGFITNYVLIQPYIDHGVSVDIADETGSTPLIWAASKVMG